MIPEIQMNGPEFNEVQKALLFFLGECEELVQRGYVARGEGVERLSATGMEEYRKLKQAGYAPSPDFLQLAGDIFRDEDA